MTELQQVKTPSETLLQLLELSDPASGEPQHFTDLANQSRALFLMRRGNQAVIGYLVSQYPTHEAARDFYRELNDPEGLKSQGCRVETDEEGNDINFYFSDKPAPSIKTYFLDMERGDFHINNETESPLPGQAIMAIIVSLEDLVKEKLVPPALEAIVHYQAPSPFLPVYFNSDFISPPIPPTEEERKELVSDIKKSVGTVRGGEVLTQETADSILAWIERNKLASTDTPHIIFNQLFFEALQGIKDRYKGDLNYTRQETHLPK